ncbi:ABC transporter ATP-binding protein [Tunturiibacter gelidoferens]|uniref:ATP-binding cassette subfamily B protein n=3 Tax=Tunturiibacter TaxID=3154218 RepID=A0A7Y9T5P6_9BACT|nr:ABC transporter ATP-binding protein [Edaphobacter lichenicola]MBB5338215.1 ATP-binding cassette subfamily B protein [Edaphobacter lichenicola]NYF52544.1 ATP-binding cassette subfamily B protein [Edaphobacter lichenicola]
MADEQKPKDPKEQPAKKPSQDDEVAGKAYDARLMRRLLTYLKPYKLQTGLSALTIFFKASTDVMGPYLVKVAVDTYMTDTPPAKLSWLARHLSSRPMTGITQIGCLYLGALLLTYVLEFAQTYMMQWTGQKIMFDLRSQIFRHLQRMQPSFFDHNPVGKLVTRVTSDVDALNEMFTSGVLAIFEDIFVLLFIVLIMLRMSWPLALLALSVIPAILYVTKIFRRHVRDSYRRQRAATARINSFTQEYVSGMSIVQLFNRERRAFNDYSSVNAENKQAWTDAIFAYAVYYPVVEFLSSTAIALVIWRGGISALHYLQATQLHELQPILHALPKAGSVVTVGVLIAFIQYAQRFFRPIQDLSEKYNILQAAMAASERVFNLLDTQPTIISPASPILGDDSGRVEFRNVWFTYQKLDEAQYTRVAAATEDELNTFADIEWILRGVSFTVEPDETAAIVGHTGAGKTTITGLMMRFYDIQRGSILVDGVDVREQDLKKLRQRFGVVLQDPFLFTGTIADNIRLGSKWITDERLELAADEVNIGDFIRSLPLQFAEPVRERGATLSTGQKQLISFARALAHSPRILILDEATSSVDTDTELRVRLALSRMITGRTSILIAHRLSTIQRADTILVMHKGQLRERGTHQQLLTERGLYWKLYQLQYRDQELGSGSDSIPLEPLSAD